MGRSEGDFKHLLDTNADQNIGNGKIIQPQAGGATVIPQTNPERLLMLSGPSKAGQTTSIVLTASRIVGANNPNPGFPGPITGIIEFGNGGQFTRVEVDIPIGPFVGTQTSPAPASEPQDGGTIVTVPTGVLRVYARYDNQLVQPVLEPLTRSLAQLNGVAFKGPGGPTGLGNNVFPPEPVLVKAMAAYFSRHTSKAYRTHYCYLGNSAFPNIPNVPIVLGPLGTSGVFCIPAFARSLKIFHMPISTAFIVTLSDNMGNQLDQLSSSGGTIPVIPLIGTETVVTIIGGLTEFLALSYEIGV